MATAFSQIVADILDKYPSMIGASKEASEASKKASEASKEAQNIKTQIQSLKDETSKQIADATASAKNVAQNAAKLATTAATNAANANNLAANHEANSKAYMSAANEYMKATEKLEASAKNDILVTNAAKLKAQEAQTKTEVYLSQAQALNAGFKTKVDGANAALKKTYENTAGALSKTADFELGRMEFKRRQVIQKLDEANEAIEKLENKNIAKEFERLIIENAWDHALLECGLMDTMLSKFALMFVEIQTEQIKDQTEKIAQEVELDRLEIQRIKQIAKFYADEAKAIYEQI